MTKFNSPEKEGLQNLLVEAVEKLHEFYEFEYEIHTEYLFAKKFSNRDWRADWFVSINNLPALIIEYDGIFAQGSRFTGKSGHLTPKGFTGDSSKLNTATEMGIASLRYTVIHMDGPMVVGEQIYNTLLRIIQEKGIQLSPNNEQ